MSEAGETKTDGGEAQGDQRQTGAEAGAQVVPISALQAERAKRQELAQELEAFRAAQAEAERKAAEERGEFRRLYEEASGKLTSTTAELEALRAAETARREALTARNAERVEALPTHLRSVIAALGDAADPEVVSRQLDALSSVAGQASTVEGGRVRGGDAGGLDPKIAAWRDAHPRYAGLSDEAVTRIYRAKHKG